ncbi:uncharacterized protein PFL1_06320 [Pseudozyma flocculosa PF-1]|uniref:Uncharacterized protein n=2 Tax=Pseudozyma flocculosa TaxID=84751 RepID=A0A5C3F9E1_9BASI|nr:uncharacterized protein PFL1_06320 [Pseudozyma flocculosa PF-1]EPQ26112.1 hypothetical protein PFL1_06320 [Pseudozyma flocculosa PF-1]SPO40357.1 uncharacterized protein PSFLO_05839 [Pseudozyma flocculosa]
MSSPIPPHSAQSSFRGRSSPLVAPSGPRLTLALRPSVSLGPFKLGLSLWHTIDYLRSHHSLFPHVNIAFDQHSPRLSPIVVSVEPYLNLIFSGVTQRLVVITLDRLAPNVAEPDPADRPVSVVYNGRTIYASAAGTGGGAPSTLTRSALQQLLGPTYPGWTQKRSNPYLAELARPAATAQAAAKEDVDEFVLGYPGVAFAFVKKPHGAGGREGEIDKHHPVSTIYVFNGSSPAQPEEVILSPFALHQAVHAGLASPSSGRTRGGALSPTFSDPGAGSLSEADRAALDPEAIHVRAPSLLEAVIEPHRGMTLHFARGSASRTASPLPPASTKLQGGNGSSAAAHVASTVVELLLGVTTPQDAVCDLGAPQRVFYKEDDRMRIHAGGRGSGGAEAISFPPDDLDGDAMGATDDAQDGSSDGDSPFFYNYFDLGIDLLFSSRADVASSIEAAHLATTTGQARLEKVVCHTNVAGDALFQRYNRCPWKVVEVQRNESSEDAKEAKAGKQKGGGGAAETTASASATTTTTTKVLYGFEDDFKPGATTAAPARIKPASASTSSSPTKAAATNASRQGGASAVDDAVDGPSMELDRGTCAEFNGGLEGQLHRGIAGGGGMVGDDTIGGSVGSNVGGGGAGLAVSGGAGAGGGGVMGTFGSFDASYRDRGNDAVHGVAAMGQGQRTGTGQHERDSLVKLDLSTELVARPGLVLEVGRDGSVVGVVVF